MTVPVVSPAQRGAPGTLAPGSASPAPGAPGSNGAGARLAKSLGPFSWLLIALIGLLVMLLVVRVLVTAIQLRTGTVTGTRTSRPRRTGPLVSAWEEAGRRAVAEPLPPEGPGSGPSVRPGPGLGPRPGPHPGSGPDVGNN